jgi:hypothetical protein
MPPKLAIRSISGKPFDATLAPVSVGRFQRLDCEREVCNLSVACKLRRSISRTARMKLQSPWKHLSWAGEQKGYRCEREKLRKIEYYLCFSGCNPNFRRGGMSDPILTDAYWSLGVATASPLLAINFALIRFTAQQEHRMHT